MINKVKSFFLGQEKSTNNLRVVDGRKPVIT